MEKTCTDKYDPIMKFNETAPISINFWTPNQEVQFSNCDFNWFCPKANEIFLPEGVLLRGTASPILRNQQPSVNTIFSWTVAGGSKGQVFPTVGEKIFNLFNIFSADLGQHGRKVWMVGRAIHSNTVKRMWIKFGPIISFWHIFLEKRAKFGTYSCWWGLWWSLWWGWSASSPPLPASPAGWTVWGLNQDSNPPSRDMLRSLSTDLKVTWHRWVYKA